MTQVNDPENFQGRVDYAAQVISEGAATSRNFDSCFENYDGDEVAAAMVRRSETDERLAANLFRYLCRETVLAAAERLKGKDLAKEARATRERSAAASFAKAEPVSQQSAA
ncbi:hypothetical protein [Microvirga tunisiensis]|uniref:Uncharacterized protein n=1 Tax=Microvirga tunisiensis TaxID=2108360 RepID=A0A5N7MVN4_9HYPH|nr:hypothetical protein [Microvirga tunisiensis]MPR13160.1 hypothetical protein [Microvirga tunisiensis]MPR31042.1 hypothetical protein [Microvirga tunisiensis]